MIHKCYFKLCSYLKERFHPWKQTVLGGFETTVFCPLKPSPRLVEKRKTFSLPFPAETIYFTTFT